MKKFKVRYIFITLAIIALIVIGIIMRKTFVGKLIFIALGILIIVIGIVMLKIKGKIRLRYILIPLSIIVALFVIGNIARLTFAGQVKNMQKTFEADMDRKVNSIVDERLADFYSNQNSYTPSNPDSIPDASGNSTASIPDASGDFTSVAWPEDSAPESTSSAESKKITAAITNYAVSPNDEKHSISIFESYDDAFGKAFVLEAGRHVIFSLKANVKIEDINSIVSVFNPETGELEEFDDFTFDSSKNSNNEYLLTFEVPDNPYNWAYTADCVNFVAVFEIVTNEGTFYVSCAY